ncbi:hypothetical protein COT82_00515 [Candidatus Campbellbacteria bacterium CG10_big_fil_rev_8_21_14_0_10_35_52]|uniref:Uncharacterized protein n=1 Tax=Candidatus Campbellbacteria bacterium CG10_big_fil_rev_8_21_14_0_10_35_52 TaxID=1974527 RepID=A0A2M6WVT7_9BACT|nr:MAG: hypothetical protein COT82_00515 [Candidatus Campbellbacteria bacterium CG10_big_fil_rev_8_21_14_0_10_35_52]
MKIKTKQINIFEKRMFVALVCAILTLLAFYGYFISKSIVNVIVREEVGNDIVFINSAISGLETEYISHKNVINMEFAKSNDFVSLTNKEFVTRKSLATTLDAVN